MTKEQAQLHVKGLKVIAVTLLTMIIYYNGFHNPWLDFWKGSVILLTIAIPFAAMYYGTEIIETLYPGESHDDYAAAALLIFVITGAICVFILVYLLEGESPETTILNLLFHRYTTWLNS